MIQNRSVSPGAVIPFLQYEDVPRAIECPEDAARAAAQALGGSVGPAPAKEPRLPTGQQQQLPASGPRTSFTTTYVRFAPERATTASPGSLARTGRSAGDTRLSETSERPIASLSTRAFSSCTVLSVIALAGRPSAPP